MLEDLWLVHPEPKMCEAFQHRFEGLPRVRILQASFADVAPHDCFVTAGNAFGIMTAGIDAAVVARLGDDLMRRVQHQIMDYYFGEQPVGTAFVIPSVPATSNPHGGASAQPRRTGFGLTLARGTTTRSAMRWKRGLVATSSVVVCLYLPFCWIPFFLSDRPKFTWESITFWAILPGLVPGAFLFRGIRPDESLGFVVMGAIALMLVAGLTWLATSGPRRFWVAVGLALLLAVPSSIIAHALFRA